MTIICWRDGVLAADTAQFEGKIRVSVTAQKITRLAGGILVASCGDHSVGELFVAAVDRHWPDVAALQIDMGDAVVPDEFEGIVVDPDGAVWRVSNAWLREPIGDRPLAIGSAWEVAYGAMFAGATAAQAVQICIDNHVYCGGTVQIEQAGVPRADLLDDEIHEDVNGVPQIRRHNPHQWSAPEELPEVAEAEPFANTGLSPEDQRALRRMHGL